MIKSLFVNATILTLGLLPTGLSAQDEGKEVRQATVIQVPVTGLTGENIDQVASRMQKVGIDPDHCDMNDKGGTCVLGKDCKDVSCGGCPMKVVTSAKADVAKQVVLLSVAPEKSVRLSQIVAAFEESPIAVDEDKLALTGKVTLSVEGLTCNGCASKAVKAVKTVKGAGAIDVVLESKEESFLNLTLDEGGAKYSDLLAAMETTNYFIGDVSWKAASTSDAGCCSEEEQARPSACCKDAGADKATKTDCCATKNDQ